MPLTAPAATTGSSRAVLSRDVIVEAARVAIDETGPEGLTMRTFGQRLGVQEMAPYTYVKGREDLLEAVVNRLLQDATEGPDEQTGAVLAGVFAGAGSFGEADRAGSPESVPRRGDQGTWPHHGFDRSCAV